VLAALSEYFDVMFGGKFKEKDLEEISLHDVVDAEAFKKILNFAYTGYLPTFTVGNAYILLRTSQYLKVSEIEDECVDYIRNNISSIANSVGILQFASATNKGSLIKDVIAHICENFRAFYEKAELCELSLHELKALLIEYKSPLSVSDYLRFKQENLLLDYIIR